MNVVWEATLDQVYQVRVVRTSTSTGEFSVERDGKVIHSEPVGLSYGAVLGPDASDVAEWQMKALSIVDARMMVRPTVPDDAPDAASMKNGEANFFADRMTLAEIVRFSPVAAKIIPRIMRHWSVSDEDGARLLNVSITEWNEMKTETWKGLLSQAQLERASLLINIFSELRQLYSSQEVADRWVSGAIHAAPFQGKRPLDVMLAGSADLLRVRCWVLEATAIC